MTTEQHEHTAATRTEEREAAAGSAAWLAFQHWTGGRDVQRFSDTYVGHFDDRRAFGLHLAIEFGAEERLARLPPWLRAYVQLDGEQITADFVNAGHFYVIDLPENEGCIVFDAQQ